MGEKKHLIQDKQIKQIFEKNQNIINALKKINQMLNGTPVFSNKQEENNQNTNNQNNKKKE